MPNILKSWIVANRRRALVEKASRLAARFLNAFYNTGEYDFDTNGEAFALQAFSKLSLPNPVIWDIGAHYGEYAIACKKILPHATIVSFEILPPIAEKLCRRLDIEGITVINLGLSDSVGDVDVTWNRRLDSTNSINPMLETQFFSHGDLEVMSCKVSTIDRIVAEGRRPPDFLKIDVEGHEPAVLRGAAALLGGPHAPAMIQFEYGQTWIAGGELLYHVQRQLEAVGYKVGRLYPDHVSFKRFDWQDEHFRMGNYLAVKNAELKKLLS